MVLTDKKLCILGGLAVVMLAATVLVYSGGLFESSGDFVPDSFLIQGLDPDIVSEISIVSGDDSVTLQRTANGFSVKERRGYLASNDKINKIFNNLEIRCEDKVTENKDNHQGLGVSADDKDATVIKLMGKDGKVVTGVVVGGQAPRGSGVYVRVVGQDAVYVSRKRVSFSTNITDYVDTELVKVVRGDVNEVTVTSKGGTYVAGRDSAGGVVLRDIPKGKRAKQSDVDTLFDALSNLTFDDIVSDTSVAANPDVTFVCKTKAHATYVVNLSEKGGKHYVTLICGGPSEEILESLTIAPDDPESKLKLNEAILLARDNAPKFTARHSNWVYEIAAWDAAKMRKSLSDLVEDIPDPNNPDKVTASHILIGYKGSSRSKASRTKAEARKLAEDVLAQAKAHRADFAALARKYSEGPSGKNGGDLGEFDKKTMHENFTKASWKLKVGQVSGIVETPFGFHVIKRTK